MVQATALHPLCLFTCEPQPLTFCPKMHARHFHILGQELIEGHVKTHPRQEICHLCSPISWARGRMPLIMPPWYIGTTFLKRRFEQSLDAGKASQGCSSLMRVQAPMELRSPARSPLELSGLLCCPESDDQSSALELSLGVLNIAPEDGRFGLG